MTRKTHIGLMLILTAAIALGGCRGKKSESSSENIPVGGETPKQALLNIVKGFDDENVKLIKASIYVPDEIREFANSMLDSRAAMVQFYKDLEAAYGEEADEYKVSMKDENLPSIEEVEKLTIEKEGDKATATRENKRPIKFIKKDGRWFVDLTDKMPKENLKELTISSRTVVELLDKHSHKIGKEGYTAKKIMEEIEEDFEKAEEEAAEEERRNAARAETVTPGANDAPPVVRRADPDEIAPEPEVTKAPPVVKDAPPLPKAPPAVVVEVPAVPVPSADAAAPRAVMLKVAEAFKTLDMDTILANMYVEPKDKPFVEAMFRYVGALKTFERKLKATYTSDELKVAGFTISDDDDIPTAEDVKNMTFEVTGDTATATKEGEKPTKLVKKDGQWLLTFDESLPPVEKREQIITQISMARKIVTGLLPKIGAKGVTAQDIQDQYRAEILKAMETLKK